MEWRSEERRVGKECWAVLEVLCSCEISHSSLESAEGQNLFLGLSDSPRVGCAVSFYIQSFSCGVSHSELGLS